jgi:hypothetical protein
MAFGTVNFNSRACALLITERNSLAPLQLLMENYGGSFLPAERSCSGNILIKTGSLPQSQNKTA